MRRSPARTDRLCALREISLGDPLADTATAPNARLPQFDIPQRFGGHKVLRLVASAVIDLVLFTGAFRLLTPAPVTTRQVLPCAVLASGCWLALQAVGATFVTQVLAGRSQTYGGFARLSDCFHGCRSPPS